ncbi:hypothetical protein GGR57DRAFT_477183 [Xylariaceae sp. FL1272]|nr:hypothetical protein GGR57DRAFT_477183 [Xylariaceae sp. FL1272]
MAQTVTTLNTSSNASAWHAFASQGKETLGDIIAPQSSRPTKGEKYEAQTISSKDQENVASVQTGNSHAWQTFAAEGKQVQAKEQELQDRIALTQQGGFAPDDAFQPEPIRFYGPGPGGYSQNGTPVGTLHYARYRHELAGVADPNGGGYFHEMYPVFKENGDRCRPTYTTKGRQPAREVNYFRWGLVPAAYFEHNNINTFPGPGTIRVHDEYLLNQSNFNPPDFKDPKIGLDLNNRIGEPLEKIYPRGYGLLKKWSQTNGYAEWQIGQPLGPDPSDPDALTSLLGW